MYNVIIDSGNSENVVSRALVKALGFLIEPHLKPYQIGWIKGGLRLKLLRCVGVIFH